MAHSEHPGPFVVVSNPVPGCAKESIFGLPWAAKCGYSEKAQRFPGDN